MRPNRLIVRAYVARGGLLWAGARTMLSGVFLLAGTNPLHLPVAALAEIVLLSIILGFLETHRRRERALLGNLAIGPLVLGGLFAGPAAIGELALYLVTTAVS